MFFGETKIVSNQEIQGYTDQLLKHFMTLSSDDLELRFFKSMTKEQITIWIETLSKKENHFILVFNSKDEIVGLGQLAVSENSGDLSFSIVNSARGFGLGHNLLSKLISKAKNLEIKKLYVVFKSCNAPVKKMISKFKFSLDYDFGEVQGVLIQ